MAAPAKILRLCWDSFHKHLLCELHPLAFSLSQLPMSLPMRCNYCTERMNGKAPYKCTSGCRIDRANFPQRQMQTPNQRYLASLICSVGGRVTCSQPDRSKEGKTPDPSNPSVPGGSWCQINNPQACLLHPGWELFYIFTCSCN